MKRRTRAAIAAILTLMAAACAGTAARENVLLPAMRAAWPAIQAQAEAQAAPGDRAAIAAMDAAMTIGTEAAIAGADWQAVRSLAIARIHARSAAGEIGAGVAASLSERVNQFDKAVASYIARVKQ